MNTLRVLGLMSFIVFDVASPLSGCSNNRRQANPFNFSNQVVYFYGLNFFIEKDEKQILTYSNTYINLQLDTLDTTILQIPDGVPESYKGYTFDGWYLMEHCTLSDYSNYISIKNKVEFPYTYSKEDIINTEFIENSIIFAQKRTSNI
jgi:hypothetical protein